MTSQAPKNSTKFWSILKIIFVCFLFSVAYLIIADESLSNDFKRLSLTQYQTYVYGKSDYCEPGFDALTMMKALQQKIYGQTEALAEIATVLTKHQNISSIAIIGSQGVGKSLTLNTIYLTFPWQYNMHYVSWSNIMSQQALLLHLIRILLHLTSCGQNGIFVDNIRYEDANIIAAFDAAMKQFCLDNEMSVIAVYVFNIGHASGSSTIVAQDSSLIEIPRVTSIHYRRFDIDDLRQCVERETMRLGVSLTRMQVNRLIDNIDVTNTGCKTVAAKVARHIQMEV